MKEPRIYQSSLKTKLEHMAVHDAVMKRKIKEKGSHPIEPASVKDLRGKVLGYRIWNSYTGKFLGEGFDVKDIHDMDEVMRSLQQWRETWEGEGGSADHIALLAVIDA